MGHKRHRLSVRSPVPSRFSWAPSPPPPTKSPGENLVRNRGPHRMPFHYIAPLFGCNGSSIGQRKACSECLLAPDATPRPSWIKGSTQVSQTWCSLLGGGWGVSGRGDGKLSLCLPCRGQVFRYFAGFRRRFVPGDSRRPQRRLSGAGLPYCAPVDREGRRLAGAPEPKQIGEGTQQSTER